jgi:hypothetical protein
VKPFDIWLDRAAKMSCIGSLIAQSVFGFIALRGVSQVPSAEPPPHINWYFAAWVGTTLVSAVLVYFAFKGKREPPEPQPPSNPPTDAPTPRLDAAKRELDKLLADRRIYIGPSGTSLRLINEELRVSLQIFPCVTVRLLHVKVQVGSSQNIKATLTDAEPHELEAGKKFEKTLERSLNDAELAEMRRDLVLVQGTAKFDGNLEVSFVFNANPLRI